MDATTRCAYCGKEILRADTRCKHCGSDLRETTRSHIGPPPAKTPSEPLKTKSRWPFK
jgi:predicted amidophosphoribosyltransferase